MGWIWSNDGESHQGSCRILGMNGWSYPSGPSGLKHGWVMLSGKWSFEWEIINLTGWFSHAAYLLWFNACHATSPALTQAKETNDQIVLLLHQVKEHICKHPHRCNIKWHWIPWHEIAVQVLFVCVCACAHLGPYILAGGLGISSGRRSVPEAVVCGRTGTEPKCAQGERALEARTQRPGHFFSVLRPPDIRSSMVSSNKSRNIELLSAYYYGRISCWRELLNSTSTSGDVLSGSAIGRDPNLCVLLTAQVCGAYAAYVFKAWCRKATWSEDQMVAHRSTSHIHFLGPECKTH